MIKWLHGRRPVEMITDSATGELSMSRFLSWYLACLLTVWVFACIFRLPAKEAYVPVSACLGGGLGAALGSYGFNSFAGARGRFSVGLEYGNGQDMPVRRAKPAPQQGE